jgi:hypothetical protein
MGIFCLIYKSIGLIIDMQQIFLWISMFLLNFTNQETGQYVSMNDTPLNAKVNADFCNVPLSDVLQALSQKNHVQLGTYTYVGAQRITIEEKDKPLAVVMDNIANVLSHQVGTKKSCRWEKRIDAKGNPLYFLVPTSQYRQEEQEMLRSATEKSKLLMKEWRDMSRLTDIDRKKKINNLPESIYDKNNAYLSIFTTAISDLSDNKLEILFTLNAVSVNKDVLKIPMDNYNRDVQKNFDQTQESHASLGLPIQNKRPDEVKLSDSIQFNIDKNIARCRPYETRMCLMGFPGTGTILLNPFNPNPWTLSKTIMEEDKNPIIDLDAILEKKGATRSQRESLPFLLKILSEASGCSIYQEQFYKVDMLGGPIMTAGAMPLKGTPTDIINRICKNWEYNAVKKNNTFFLWSKTWAFDKQADISEKNVNPWRKRFLSGKEISSDEIIKMCSEFSYSQIRITLYSILEESLTKKEISKSILPPFLSETQRKEIIANKKVNMYIREPEQELDILPNSYSWYCHQRIIGLIPKNMRQVMLGEFIPFEKMSTDIQKAIFEYIYSKSYGPLGQEAQNMIWQHLAKSNLSLSYDYAYIKPQLTLNIVEKDK